MRPRPDAGGKQGVSVAIDMPDYFTLQPHSDFPALGGATNRLGLESAPNRFKRLLTPFRAPWGRPTFRGTRSDGRLRPQSRHRV